MTTQEECDYQDKVNAASAMLAALKEIADHYEGEEGFDRAMSDGLDAHLIEVRAAIAQAEAAGIAPT
jgi:hypothetical protein